MIKARIAHERLEARNAILTAPLDVVETYVKCLATMKQRESILDVTSNRILSLEDNQKTLSTSETCQGTKGNHQSTTKKRRGQLYKSC